MRSAEKSRDSVSGLDPACPSADTPDTPNPLNVNKLAATVAAGPMSPPISDSPPHLPDGNALGLAV
jgi:hypothetical protein